MGNKLLKTNPWFAFLHPLGSLIMVWILSACIGRILFNKPSAYRPTNKNRVTIQAQGSTIKVYVNGSLQISYTDASPLLLSGRIALESDFSHVHYDNIAVAIGSSTTTYDFSNDDNTFSLGHGWTHPYDWRIREYPNHVTLISHTNARTIYVPQPDGSYTPIPSNNYLTLTKDASGFSLRTTHGLHYRFNPAGALLYLVRG